MECPCLRSVVLLLFLSIQRITSESCPVSCSCEDEIFSCQNLQLREILPPHQATVQTVQLGGNLIQYLGPSSFSSNFENVIRLKLNDNQLSNIGDRTFEGSASLQALDLSGNLLKNLSVHTFTGIKSSLLHLDLSNNKLVSVDGAFRDLLSLSRLDLSKNLLQTIERETFSDLHNLRYLLLTENKIHHVADNAFAGLEKLVYFTGKGNDFGEQKDVKFTFNTSVLSYLDLSESKLTHVPFNLPDSVRYLQLRRNNITTVSRNSFSNSSQVNILILDENVIDLVEDGAFQHLANLQQLWMNYNKLSQVPKSLPVNVKRLLMQSNSIHALQESTFAEKANLETLDLAGNDIVEIAPGSLGRLVNLETLDISKNKLLTLSRNTFDKNIKIKSLLLSRNPLQSIESGSFKALSELTELSLSFISTNLTNFDKESLSSCVNLTLLNLDNSPSMIESALTSTTLLSSLHKLEELNLRNSHLKTLGREFEDTFNGIRIVRITSNKWHCNESIAWLSGWLKGRMKTGSREISRNDNVCYLPQRWRNRAIVNLTAEQLLSVNKSEIKQQNQQEMEVETQSIRETKESTDNENKKLKNWEIVSDPKFRRKIVERRRLDSTKDADGEDAWQNNDRFPTAKTLTWDDIYDAALAANDDSIKRNKEFPFWQDYESIENMELLNDKSPPGIPSPKSRDLQTSVPHRPIISDSDRNVYIIVSVVVTVVVTIVIVIVIVTLIVRLSSGVSARAAADSRKAQNSAVSTKSAASPGSNKRVVAEISKSSRNYFLVSSSCVEANDTIPCSQVEPDLHSDHSTNQRMMTLIPGRDVNHEGPLRVYKWTDF